MNPKQFMITTIEVGYGFHTLLENSLCFKLLIFCWSQNAIDSQKD
jgi:hypothetical protein